MTKTPTWLDDTAIPVMLDQLYKELATCVTNYAYVDRFANPVQRAGRASDMVEYMVVYVKPGKEAEFEKLAARLGVKMSREQLAMPGSDVLKDCYVFRNDMLGLNGAILGQIVRRIVKIQLMAELAQRRGEETRIYHGR